MKIVIVVMLEMMTMMTVIGVLTPERPFLNYLLITGKIDSWRSRRNKELPNIQGFKFKVQLKCETANTFVLKINTSINLRKIDNVNTKS